MLYLFYGQNNILLQEKLTLLKERYSTKFSSGLNFWQLDLEDCANELEKIISHQSMFEEKKMIFARGVLSIAENNWVEIKNLLEKKNIVSNEEIILVFYDFLSVSQKTAENIKARIDFFNQQGQAKEFKDFSKTQLISWAGEQVKNLELKINRPELLYLIEGVNNDAGRVLSELQKLSLYKSGSFASRQDIDTLVSFEINPVIFNLTDALLRKNTAEAIKYLIKHRQNNDDPLMILNMLSWQFRLLLKLSDFSVQELTAENVARKLKINPWVAQKNISSFRNFSLPELKTAYQFLLEADLAIKTGTKESFEALEDFIYTLL